MFTCPDTFDEHGVPHIVVEIDDSVRMAQQCIKRTEVDGRKKSSQSSGMPGL